MAGRLATAAGARDAGLYAPLGVITSGASRPGQARRDPPGQGQVWGWAGCGRGMTGNGGCGLSTSGPRPDRAADRLGAMLAGQGLAGRGGLAAARTKVAVRSAGIRPGGWARAPLLCDPRPGSRAAASWWTGDRPRGRAPGPVAGRPGLPRWFADKTVGPTRPGPRAAAELAGAEDRDRRVIGCDIAAGPEGGAGRVRGTGPPHAAVCTTAGGTRTGARRDDAGRLHRCWRPRRRRGRTGRADRDAGWSQFVLFLLGRGHIRRGPGRAHAAANATSNALARPRGSRGPGFPWPGPWAGAGWHRASEADKGERLRRGPLPEMDGPGRFRRRPSAGQVLTACRVMDSMDWAQFAARLAQPFVSDLPEVGCCKARRGRARQGAETGEVLAGGELARADAVASLPRPGPGQRADRRDRPGPPAVLGRRPRRGGRRRAFSDLGFDPDLDESGST